MCYNFRTDVQRSAIPEHLRDVFTTRRYTNPHLPYLVTLPFQKLAWCIQPIASVDRQICDPTYHAYVACWCSLAVHKSLNKINCVDRYSVAAGYHFTTCSQGLIILSVITNNTLAVICFTVFLTKLIFTYNAVLYCWYDVLWKSPSFSFQWSFVVHRHYCWFLHEVYSLACVPSTYTASRKQCCFIVFVSISREKAH